MPKIPGLKWRIRETSEEDIPLILDLCYQLSVYEKLEFKGTPELYRKYGFSEDKIFDCLLVENTGDIGPDYLGVALFYYPRGCVRSPSIRIVDVSNGRCWIGMSPVDSSTTVLEPSPWMNGPPSG